MRKSPVLLLACFLCFAATVAAADEIRVEGGGSTIASVVMPIKEEFEKSSGHKLNIVQTSAVKGLIALHKGKVDIAAGAHHLEDLIAGAEKEGVKINASELFATQVEENRLIVIVHPSNPVQRLSKEQLKSIFTGKVNNWKVFNEKDLPITVVWGKETQGQNIQFTRMLLDGEAVTKNMQEVVTYQNISKFVGGNPGAIGAVPIGMSSGKTKAPEIPVITSPMFFITKGKPSLKVQQLIDFYSKVLQ